MQQNKWGDEQKSFRPMHFPEHFWLWRTKDKRAKGLRGNAWTANYRTTLGNGGIVQMNNDSFFLDGKFFFSLKCHKNLAFDQGRRVYFWYPLDIFARLNNWSGTLLFQVLHEPLIDEDPVFISTCTEREQRKRKKRKFSLWVRQCTSTGFICQVGAYVRPRQIKKQRAGLFENNF